MGNANRHVNEAEVIAGIKDKFAVLAQKSVFEVKIIVAGYQHTGKSSLLNSLARVLQEEPNGPPTAWSQKFLVGNAQGCIATRQVRKERFTTSSGVTVILIDTPNFEKSDSPTSCSEGLRQFINDHKPDLILLTCVAKDFADGTSEPAVALAMMVKNDPTISTLDNFFVVLTKADQIGMTETNAVPLVDQWRSKYGTSNVLATIHYYHPIDVPLDALLPRNALVDRLMWWILSEALRLTVESVSNHTSSSIF